MTRLRNWQHERFAQELSKRLCACMKAPQARTEAYAAAGYPVGSAIVDNARKLACRDDVRARVAELNAVAFEVNDITREWCTLILKRKVDGFNFDDFLSGKPGDADRCFDLSKATREHLAMLSELTIEDETEFGGEDEAPRRVRKIKLKGHDVKGIVDTIAKLRGFTTDKVALTNATGDGPANITVSWKDPEPAKPADAKAA